MASGDKRANGAMTVILLCVVGGLIMAALIGRQGNRRIPVCAIGPCPTATPQVTRS